MNSRARRQHLEVYQLHEIYDHSIPYEDTRAAHRNRTHLGAFIPCIRGQKQLAVPLTGSAPAIVHHLGSQPVCCRIAPPALTQSIIL